MHSSAATLDPLLGDHTAISAPRPFGNQFARQQRAYLVHLPLLLIVSGLITWLAPSNATFVLGAAVGAFAGVYLLVDIVVRGAALRFSSLLAMTMLLAYNLGALNSWLTIPRAGLTIAEYFTRNPADLARATGACMAAAALLLAVGQIYERPIFGEEFRMKVDSRAQFIVILSTLLMLAGYATGNFGFMGITVNEYGHMSALAALVMWWSAPAFAYSVYVTLNSRRLIRLLMGACTLVQLIALVPTGRRYFAYSVLLALIATRLGQYRARMSTGKKILLVAAGLIAVSLSSFAFLYLRIAGWGHREAPSFETRVRLAYDTLHSRSGSEILGLMRGDASTRTFIIGYLSDLLGASMESSPLYGTDAIHYLKLMVPSALSANKFNNEPYEEEQLADMKWGFGYIDEANTVLTAGATDFGILGMLVYPLLIVLLLRVVLEWTQSFMPTFAAIMIALALLYEALLPEQSLAGYFGQVRNGLIFAGLLYVLSALPKFQIRSPQQG